MSPLLLRSTFRRPNRFWEGLFPVCGALSWGGRSPSYVRARFPKVPFEEDDRSLEVAFEAYGAVTSVKKQTFLSN